MHDLDVGKRQIVRIDLAHECLLKATACRRCACPLFKATGRALRAIGIISEGYFSRSEPSLRDGQRGGHAHSSPSSRIPAQSAPTSFIFSLL